MNSNELILNRINQFISSEGFRKDYLAMRMKKSLSTFYSHLQGKHEKSTYQFAVELAEVLGLERSFFIEDDFNYQPRHIQMGLNTDKIAYSVGELSEKGRTGLNQIGKLCDLIRIYS